MWELWRQISQYPWFLDDPLRNPYIFREVLRQRNTRIFYLTEPDAFPAGLVYAFGITPNLTANVAIAVWDRAAKGRDELLQLGLKAVAREANLHKFYAHVAMPNVLGHRIAQRLGFRKEGELRSALCYDGTWTDVSLYGLLTENLWAAQQQLGSRQLSER